MWGGLLGEIPSSLLDAFFWEAVYVAMRVLDQEESGDLASSVGCHFQLRDLEQVPLPLYRFISFSIS